MSKQKRVLIVSNSNKMNLVFRKDLIRLLGKQGYEVLVLGENDMTEEVEGFNLIGVNFDNCGTSIFRDFLLLCSLIRTYHKVKPDLIMHYAIKPNIYGSIAAFILGIPSVSVISGLGYTFINNGVVSKTAKLLYKFAMLFPKKVLFSNVGDMNAFINNKIMNPKKAELIEGEGVDTNFYHPVEINKEKRPFTFVMICRLLGDKGIYEYIYAAEQMKTKGLEVVCVLAGESNSKNPTAIRETQLNEYMDKGVIKYYGRVKEVRDFIAEADCSVLPSYREGLSRFLLESASMGKPIITTNVPGCREVIIDGVTGFLCNPRDEKDLLDKMLKIYNTRKEDLVSMGLKGRDRILSNFSNDIITPKYFNIISDIVSGDQV